MTAACQPHVNIWWHPPAGPKNSRVDFRTSSLATGPAVINKVVGEETYVVVSDEGETYDVVRPTARTSNVVECSWMLVRVVGGGQAGTAYHMLKWWHPPAGQIFDQPII